MEVVVWCGGDGKIKGVELRRDEATQDCGKKRCGSCQAAADYEGASVGVNKIRAVRINVWEIVIDREQVEWVTPLPCPIQTASP
jgi:hypothetical protein